ncbi:MAG: carboxypeptidase-like regulatory domain-containing protein, partial [Tannerella sp.]|nr:carboxypeptidase-like regulatory domain-containing protein [Tannerella sp.]
MPTAKLDLRTPLTLKNRVVAKLVKKLCKHTFLCVLVALCFPLSVFSQQNSPIVIKGCVLDEKTNEPLTGASILFVNNGKEGTIADIDGNFTLRAQSL